MLSVVLQNTHTIFSKLLASMKVDVVDQWLSSSKKDEKVPQN